MSWGASSTSSRNWYVDACFKFLFGNKSDIRLVLNPLGLSTVKEGKFEKDGFLNFLS